MKVIIRLSPFLDIQSDIVAHRGNVCNQRNLLGFIGSEEDWIKRIKDLNQGKLYAKNQGPDSRNEKVICLLSNFRDRHCGL